MTSYTGGTRVRSGYYVERRTLGFVHVDRDGTPLPGDANARYVEVPVMAVMAAAPVLGGLFVVALPFIGIGVTAYGIGRRLVAGARAGATELAATMSGSAPVPGEAHLTGSPAAEGEAPAGAPPARDDRTAALEKEIEAHRGTVY